MELRSQAVRKLAPENDPLKIGMGWKVDDLAKPQIMVESTFGDSHPGSAHLDQFVKEAVQAVNTHGGKAARYFATDMCDGIAQGHDGINYSLPHRDAIVNLVEAQANATVYDGGVFIASCDKSMPAMLMSIGRLKDMSAIVVTGGVMEAHTLPKKYVVNDPACAINDLLTLEQIGKFDAWEKTGVIPNEQLDYYKHNACFALPYMNVALGVISPDSNVITTLDNWNADDQMIVISGTTAETYLTKEYPDIPLQKYDSYATAKNALENGNGVAWANDNTEVIAFAKQNTGYTVGIPSLGSQDTIAPAVSQGNTTVLDWLNEEIKALGEENFFHKDYEETLVDTYGLDYEDELVVEGGVTGGADAASSEAASSEAASSEAAASEVASSAAAQ